MVWTVTIIIALFVAAWFFWPQLGVLVFTALMAYMFYPLYKKLKRKGGSVAAGVTLFASFLVVLIPLAFVTIAAISQLATLAETVSRAQYWQNMPEFAQKAIDITNSVLAPITGHRPSVTETGVIEFLRNTLPGVARNTAQFLLGVLSSIPRLGLAFIVYTYTFLALLRYGPALVKKIKALSPFSPAVTDRYVERVGLMANAMVKGQLIMSMITSAFSALLLVPLGYGHLFFILFILFTILNFIPLGCGIILIPMALYSMFTGQFWMGLIVIIVYYTFGNLDPIWRTKLIPKKIQLPVALTMIATFCGVAYFGVLGIVYGPIITILIVTTIDLYIAAKQGKLADT
jgi:predicted PurR-regulated permease PerM